MKSYISFKKIWADDDLSEFEVVVNDGGSSFSNQVYVAPSYLKETIKDLLFFKEQIRGGLYDLTFGRFGQEYADGAFQARLHFQDRGKIFISVKAQSEFFDFGRKKVASEALLFLISEPALLDNFIEELKSLDQEIGNTATLECLVE